MNYKRLHTTSLQSTDQAAHSQAGFTIIELMIATLVFGVVLLVITFGVIRFTTDYYKGINSSTTQTVAQSAVDSISQTIQFSSEEASPTDTALGNGATGAFCAGTKIFLYNLGTVFDGTVPGAATSPNSTDIGLYETNNPVVGSCAVSNVSSANLVGGTELLNKNMRLTNLSLIEQPQADTSVHIWQLSLAVAYGDADLLCKTTTANPTSVGSCAASAPNYALTDAVSGDDVTCKSQTGAQFCSLASLSTVAQQRIVQ